MSSLNKAMVIGHLGRDPELHYLPDGTAVVNISVATTATYKDKEGKKQESTEWHRIAFFGKLAEVIGEYTKKGSQIYVEGSLQTRKWTDKDGVEKYTTEIRANEMKLLGGRGANSSGGDAPPAGDEPAASAPAAKAKAAAFDDDGDSIPF